MFSLLWFYLDVKHQQSDLCQPICCLSDLLKYPDNIHENIMLSDGQEESNHIPIVIFVHIFSIFACVRREKRLVQFFSTSLSNALLQQALLESMITSLEYCDISTHSS